jgi:hypothetical protein
VKYKVGDIIKRHSVVARIEATNEVHYQISYWLEDTNEWGDSRFTWRKHDIETRFTHLPEFNAQLRFKQELEEILTND